MTFTNRLALALFLLAVVVYVADAQDVHYNYDRGANFHSYKTYQWVDVHGGPKKADVPSSLTALPSNASEIRGGDDQLLDQDVKRAVDEQLAQKDLTRVENNGDILVTYHAIIREEKGVNLSGTGWRNAGWWDGSVNGQSSSIPIGTVVIDLYDSVTKRLIWRGDATKTLNGVNKDPNKNYKQLEKAMTKLFKNYPPSPKN